MPKTRLNKVDKWIAELSDLSRTYGVALVETHDRARLVDDNDEKELGRSLCYVCGFYTTHKPTTKRKRRPVSQVVIDVEGFITRLNELSRSCGVRLELRSSPVLLVDAETLEPFARLVASSKGYTVQELQLA